MAPLAHIIRRLSGFGLMAGAVLYAPALLAAEPEMAVPKEAKVGLPQFDVSHFPGQLFWLAVTFSLLYVLMAFIALPRVKRTQDRREKLIKDDLTAARVANQFATEIAARVERAMADARAQAKDIVTGMSRQVEKDAAEQQNRQNKALMRRLHEAEERIAVEHERALREVVAQAADLAAAVLEKTTGIKARAS